MYSSSIWSIEEGGLQISWLPRQHVSGCLGIRWRQGLVLYLERTWGTGQSIDFTLEEACELLCLGFDDSSAWLPSGGNSLPLFPRRCLLPRWQVSPWLLHQYCRVLLMCRKMVPLVQISVGGLKVSSRLAYSSTLRWSMEEEQINQNKWLSAFKSATSPCVTEWEETWAERV